MPQVWRFLGERRVGNSSPAPRLGAIPVRPAAAAIPFRWFPRLPETDEAQWPRRGHFTMLIEVDRLVRHDLLS
jgi:hypothetical protein